MSCCGARGTAAICRGESGVPRQRDSCAQSRPCGEHSHAAARGGCLAGMRRDRYRGWRARSPSVCRCSRTSFPVSHTPCCFTIPAKSPRSAARRLATPVRTAARSAAADGFVVPRYRLVYYMSALGAKRDQNAGRMRLLRTHETGARDWRLGLVLEANTGSFRCARSPCSPRDDRRPAAA